MSQTFLAASGILGFLGVAFGAFAAHGLKNKLSAEMLTIFETGARYHLLHACVLLGIAILARHMDTIAIRVAGYAMVIGILIFSGSLYALAITGIRGLGAITPIGGLAFLVGWGAVAWAAFSGQS